MFDISSIRFTIEEMLKNIFLEVKKKFETAIGILCKEKITIDPKDPAAVAEYAKFTRTVREKAGYLSILVVCLSVSRCFQKLNLQIIFVTKTRSNLDDHPLLPSLPGTFTDIGNNKK
ncbi:hypothetical protein ACH5RR_026709 [Cinchona calisaya]|uniref:Uncharacterized protein n=1 Tax=Cinchona calisaya TaxID=153742 RepID=A0ABD2Z7A4_9GENT